MVSRYFTANELDDYIIDNYKNISNNDKSKIEKFRTDLSKGENLKAKLVITMTNEYITLYKYDDVCRRYLPYDKIQINI